MKKKILLLAVALLFSTASALAQSGTTGPLTWNLDDGALTISGNGAMPDYAWNEAPWYIYRTSIHTIVMETGVTTIGENAFYDCLNMTSITIPNGITTIGKYAFWYCESLISITIPNSVTSIGRSAFSDCYSLVSMTIPDGVTTIEDMIFFYCHSLSSITIPNSVTTIGENVFDECYSLSSIIIPNSVTTIGKRAFRSCTSLTSMIIPNSVTTIGVSAFSNCTSLTAITIPNSVIKIEDYAFSYCTSLTSITMPGSITTIREGTFYCCASLLSVTIPNSITTIGVYAFMDCTSLPSVTIPNSVKSIGSYAFGDCTSLTSITIPNSVTIIGGSAFSNCKSLPAVTIPSSVITIGDWAFDYCESLPSITIPSSVTKIGNYVFYGCKSMITIEVESGNEHYTSENGVLFNKDKTDLISYPAGKPETSYTIPGSVANVERNAFVYCTNLISIEVENENNSLVSEDGVLFNKDKTNLIRYPTGKTGAYIVPNKVITIKDGSFHTCMGLTVITLPNSLTKIGDGAFHTCPNLTAMTIPNSVTKIGIQAFSYCPKLPSIIIPNSVPTIENYVFSGCIGLVSVIIPKSVTKIGDWTFSNCKSLTSITNLNPIPATVTFYTFDGVNPSACTLIVPTSTVSAYQSADVWNQFNIIGGGILVNPVANNNQYGTTTGDGLYLQGETATVTATAHENYKFVKWTKEGTEVSTENPYSFTVTEDVELVAVFEEKVGVEELGITNDELRVFPNPVSGIVTISATSEIAQLQIFDIVGRLVSSLSPENKQIVFDMGVLPKGVYLVQARLKDGGVQTGKVVVR